MFDFIARWRLRRDAVRELSRLSDRELADLGISRSDIKDVAAGAAAMTRDEVVPVAAPTPPSWGAHNRRALAA